MIMKRNIFYGIISVLLCLPVLPAEAGVVNNTKIPYRSKLLHMARTISYHGTINLTLLQGVPYLTAMYYSKMSPLKISKFYNNYFETNKIPGRLAQSSYSKPRDVRLVWRGTIDGKDNLINVVNDTKNGISAIVMAVEIDESVFRSRYKQIIECFPELMNLGARLNFKNEFIEGSRYNGVYMYDTGGRPLLAIRTARERLLRKGWKDPCNQVVSPSRGGYVCMLWKEGAQASIVARRGGGSTEMVVTLLGYQNES